MDANNSRYGTALRIYDAKAKGFADRYTIIPPRHARSYYGSGSDSWASPRLWSALGTSETGHVSGLCSASPGSHLGRRIHWRDVPETVRAMCAYHFAPFVFDVDTIARHFLIAAVWADAEEGTRPRLSREAKETARRFVLAFLDSHGGLSWRAITEGGANGYGSHPDAGSASAAFGHDLYLTAAGHGVGFGDRDALPEDVREALEKVFHDEWRRWHVDAQQDRGRFYVRANPDNNQQ